MRKERNRKDERNYKKNAKRKLASQAKGITLVALVITIIIIIILATVTIRFAFTDDGIIKRAELAKDMYANDTAYTDQSMANATAYLDEMLNGVAGGGTEVPEEPEISTMQIADAKQQNDGMTEKTIVIDGKNNEIMVPKGFKIASDSGDTVQQGIVIEDVSASTDTAVQGSQYVWIPVGTFTKDDGTTSNEIKLGRYTFSTTSPGTPTLVQDAVNYTASTPINISGRDYDYTETTTYDAGNESAGTDGRNATAKNLAEFINSTKSIEEGGNGGYYIGRYEASYASGATSATVVGDYANCKAASKVSTAYDSSLSSMSYNPGTLWNFIRQPAASKVAINTYEDSSSVKSDLMNSYAWDTAIVYIQEASTPNYANATRKHTNLSNTGNLAEGVKDEVCKINDMASNVLEWTTEHSSRTDSDSAVPCVSRGGNFTSSSDYTANRYSHYATGQRQQRWFPPHALFRCLKSEVM